MFFAKRVVKADKAGVMKGEARVLSFLKYFQLNNRSVGKFAECPRLRLILLKDRKLWSCTLN